LNSERADARCYDFSCRRGNAAGTATLPGNADFNDAPNLVDEALAEVHQLKKEFNQRIAALESKLNRMKK
jgi:hypothetical protein